MSTERTLIIIKPNGVDRGLTTEIISRIRKKFNIKLVIGRFTYANIERTKEHYIDHADEQYYKRITEGLCSEIYTIIWEGDNCVSQLREFALSLRDEYKLENVPRHCNVIHASDCVDEAIRKISIWFPCMEIGD